MTIKTHKKATISDIAKAAGVSKTTVSRYLNNKFEFMSDKTKQRIKTVIEVTNYHPSSIARSLKNNKTMLIGVAIADISSPFSSSLIRGIGDVLEAYNYVPIFVNSDNDVNKEQGFIKSLVDRGIDGLIVNSVSNDNPYLIQLACQGFPVVLCDRMVKDYNFDIAFVDCSDSIIELVKRLHNQGFNPICMFTQPYHDVSPRYLKCEAFIKGMKAIGRENPIDNIYIVDSNEHSVEHNIEKILNECSPDDIPAIIGTNTVTLFRILNAARCLNLKIPEQIGICGSEDWNWGSDMNWPEIIQPGITTLTISAYEVGFSTAKLLIDRIDNPLSPKESIVITSKLEERSSTKLIL